MKPKISIILPFIRPKNLRGVYASILESTSQSFELVLCGPTSPPEDVLLEKNVKFVNDFGSPVRASNIAAALCEGELVTWTADDALFLPKALDKAIDLLNLSDVVVAKYYEGINGSQKPLQPDQYFKIGGSTWTKTPFINDNWWLFNVGVMRRKDFDNLGYWNNDFEGTFYAHTDMAIRAQSDGLSVIMSPYPMLDCDHSQPDHGPIENAQVNHDKPLYFSLYNRPDYKELLNVQKDDWKKSENIWKKRFVK